MSCSPAPQLSILDALDAAGAHPQAVRPPKIEADYRWRIGDPIPPGVVPPVEGDPGGLPRYWPRGVGYDQEIASEIWQAVLDSIPATVPEIPMPFTCIIETTRLPDGALWACLVAHHDGGLSYVTLCEGTLEWEEAPGAGMIIWAEGTRTWCRLPAKKVYDADKHAWVWKDASAHPDMEAPETLASATPEVAPEPVPAEAPLPTGGPAAFLHAINLATDAGWTKLADTLDRTTPGAVRQAVSRRVLAGDLSVVNANALLESVGLAVTPPAEPPTVAETAPEPSTDDVRHEAARRMLAGTLAVADARALLEGAGVIEPEDRSGSALLTMKPDHSDLGLGADAWALIHGVEDGWFTLRRPGGTMAPAELTITVLGNTRFWAPAVKAADGGTLFEAFMRLQAASHAARAASRRPLEEMEEAGLIRRCGTHGRAFLPPLSDILALRYIMSTGNLEKIDLYIREGADPDSPLVRRVEAICGVTAQPGGEEIWARRASPRSQGRSRTEGNHDVVAEALGHGEEPVPSPSSKVSDSDLAPRSVLPPIG